MSLLGITQDHVYYVNQKQGKRLRFCWSFRSTPHSGRCSFPQLRTVNILHVLSFLLNGSSILSNNSLRSGKRDLWNRSRNEWITQLKNEPNQPKRPHRMINGTGLSSFSTVLPLLTSLRLVIPRCQRAGTQTDAALFKKHAVFPCGSAFAGIFKRRCLHLN